MKSTYTYVIYCANCGNKTLHEQTYGVARPVKDECPCCGCYVRTSPSGE